MAKKTGIGEFFAVLTVVGIVATVVKLLSPGQKCAECDRVIGFVSAVQSLCPACSRIA